MNYLYVINNKFAEIMNSDELSDEQKKELYEDLVTQIQEQSASIIQYVRNGETYIESLKAEIERLTNLKKSAENKIEKFKNYVKESMELMNIQKVQTESGTLSIAKNPISVEIFDESIVPNEYKTQVLTTKIDKKAIADNFKQNGELIDGVMIINNKTSLRIK